MTTMLDFAIFGIASLFAVASAAALAWTLLRAALVLMRPATARRPHVTALVRGTAALARAYPSSR
jgi:hypothetical protein